MTAPPLRPSCSVPECENLAVKRYGDRLGQYQSKCFKHQRPARAVNRNQRPRKWRRKGYRKHRLETCERCGFVPEDLCQLDVDHIDGNHRNHDPSNLQTLCANCHRLKTKRERAA